MLGKWKLLLLFLSTGGLTFSACGNDNGGVVTPGDEISQDHWWDNYLDENRNPVTLPSGFKLAPLSANQRTATPKTTNRHFVLNFVIDPDWRSNLGYIFRGNDQNKSALENLAGAVEFYKQEGWLKKRETFDWEGVREDPPGSFNFVRVNRFTKLPIRSIFNGVATDLMLTLLAEPYIAFPTDTTKTWFGDPVHVSQGPGSEFMEIMQYSISYLGERRLMEDSNALETYQDVIQIKGQANQGQGRIEAYLAPDMGIIYYYYITAFGQKAAGALIGYAGENLDLNGGAVKDYFPTAGGNHWLYEFAPDDRVDEFRFSVQ